jgi:hypothetical protein
MASTNVRSWPAQVPENIGLRAAGLFQGVSEDSESLRFERACGQTALLVNRLGESQHSGRPPSGDEGDGAERVSEQVPEQRSLCGLFSRITITVTIERH